MAEARAASGPRRRRILCRNFVCGVCKWGHSCYYSHDLSMLKSSQICKHYLSGFCFYGNSCRYLHIQPAGWLSGNRRGSEPALQLKAGESSQRYHGCASTSQAAGPFSYLPGSVKSESQTVLTPESSTSQSVPQGKLTKDSAFEESKDIICGICMEKVYEKTPARDRCFAILPDCNHAFCVTCIKKWRESKGFTNNVIKACPECRVVASYFIPYKYWVVDEQKQKLIEKFKVEKRKIHCKFFLRSNGRCPFKSECIYLHEFPEGYRPSQHRQRRRRDSSPLGIMWEDDCDDEDYYHALHLLGVLTLNDSFLENLAHFEYELFDSDLSDFNQDDSDSDDDDFAI
ncbi:makorin, ring finger protein, 4 isoform X2 [Stegostoma tigrinum]|uniref:makorin, ring finger protein, 4 isoform X2 n=1 Tax=Stegostoma tigrinum TaxID=3053191 RepID=UPI00202AD00C|nr:makorin, ring finger protein, 4 isoform X2 [Stegostoma tigrinum]